MLDIMKTHPANTPQGRGSEFYWNELEGHYICRGSFLGSCLHSLVLSLRGGHSKKPDPWTMQRFAAGTESEARFKAKCTEYGLMSAPYEGPTAIGKLWDAGDTWQEQRQVTAYFSTAGEYPGLCDPTGRCYPGVCVADLHKNKLPYITAVRASLDGWGMGVEDFICNSESLYTEGVTVGYPAEFGSFVLEHKSMNRDKKAKLDACCPEHAYVLDPLLFRELMKNYGWQITGQMLGVDTLVQTIFGDNTIMPPTRAFLSVDVLEQMGQGGDYISAGYYLYYMHDTCYPSADIAHRLEYAIDMAQRGEIPICDNEYPCNWGTGRPPRREHIDPAILEEIAQAEALDLSVLV